MLKDCSLVCNKWRVNRPFDTAGLAADTLADPDMTRRKASDMEEDQDYDPYDSFDEGRRVRQRGDSGSGGVVVRSSRGRPVKVSYSLSLQVPPAQTDCLRPAVIMRGKRCSGGKKCSGCRCTTESCQLAAQQARQYTEDSESDDEEEEEYPQRRPQQRPRTQRQPTGQQDFAHMFDDDYSRPAQQPRAKPAK